MPGLYTNGLPAPSVASGTLPLPATSLVAVDTNLAEGEVPQTVGASLAALSALGFGAPVALTYAATTALDASTGSYFTETLTGNTTMAAFANPSPGQEVYLELKQDSTGSRLVTWNANVSWAGGTPPTLTITANATDVLRFTWNSVAGKWRGETVGKAFA